MNLLDTLLQELLGKKGNSPGASNPAQSLPPAAMPFPPAVPQGNPGLQPTQAGPQPPQALPGAPTEGPEVAVSASTLPVHKGMFGVKGTLRDIIGALGDGILISNGQNPIYSARRKLENEQDALQDFETAPDLSARRMMQVDPDKGYAMMSDMEKRSVAKETAQAAAKSARLTAQSKGFGILGGLAGTLNKNNYKQQMGIIRRVADDYGIELPDSPAEYDEEYAKNLSMMGVERYKQIRSGQMQDDLESKKIDRVQRRQANANYRDAALKNADDREEIARDRNEISRSKNEISRSKKDKGGVTAPRGLPPGWTRGPDGTPIDAQGRPARRIK